MDRAATGAGLMPPGTEGETNLGGRPGLAVPHRPTDPAAGSTTMYRDGHVGIGLALYAPVAFLLAWGRLFEPLALGLVGVTVASYAPDVDIRLPLVAHRGITHTVFAAVAVGLAYAVAGVYLAGAGAGSEPPAEAALVVGEPALATAAAAGFGFLVGMLGILGHLLGDALTPMGIEPLAPVDGTNYTLDLVYASNTIANKALLVVGAVLLAGAIAAGSSL